MFPRVLRPVGEPLAAPGRGAAPPEWADGYSAACFRSGTAALARAIGQVLASHRSRGSRVLVPGYGCPDLVAATLSAGGEPWIVDTVAGTPFPDLAAAPGDAAVAVVPHFLGLRCDLSPWLDWARARGATVVEDSAQRWPGRGARGAQADLVVLSFGRGKPASALGGGVLLSRGGWEPDPDRRFAWPAVGRGDRSAAAVVRRGFNLAAGPALYGVTTRIPGLGVGETRFLPLHAVEPMTGVQAALAGPAAALRARRGPSSAQQALRHAFQGLAAGWVDLASACRHPADEPLLRYPLLAPDALARDALLASLAGRGLGASAFYGTSLPSVRGLPRVAHGPLPQAEDFASRLLTLPVHGSIQPRDVARIVEVMGVEGVLGQAAAREGSSNS